MTKSTEKSTQKAILDYLSYRKDLMFWRQNSGAIKIREGGFYRFTSMNGMPDIFILKNSQLYAVEVKDVKGKQNENQKVFEKMFEKNGGCYIVAKTLEDVTHYL